MKIVYASLASKLLLALSMGALCLGLIPLTVLAASNTLSSPSYSSIKFGELFTMPVGPEGLEPSEKLLSLGQQPVSMIGYVVSQTPVVPGRMILSPLPITIGEQDESLADDLPPTVVYVHFDPASEVIQKLLDQPAGTLVKVHGILSFGQQEEADGRVSSIRLTIQ